MGRRARGRGNEIQRANQQPAPRVSIIGPKLRASARLRFGHLRARAEVLPAGSARPPTLLPLRARHERDSCWRRRRCRRPTEPLLEASEYGATAGTFARGTPRTLCLTARVAQPQTVVRMLLTSAEAIRGSLAMVDYAAGAVCLMCRPPAGGSVRPARRETLGGIRPHEATSRQRPAVADRDGPARGHRSGLGPERGARPRFGGDRDSPAAQRPHRSVPVGGFDSRRAPRPGPGWVPACTSG